MIGGSLTDSAKTQISEYNGTEPNFTISNNLDYYLPTPRMNTTECTQKKQHTNVYDWNEPNPRLVHI